MRVNPELGDFVMVIISIGFTIHLLSAVSVV